ncbi:MAG: pyruvate, phosphate dikinase [Rickettsiaceae bacterium]|nr:pyruvate, phosphate dikinase [Rickettsiaceae bacterium]
MQKWLYSFSNQNTEGDIKMIDVLGSKGAYLADMCKLQLPIPPGFTITTEFCHYYLQHKKLPEGFFEQLTNGIKTLEKLCGKIFNSSLNPLLVSVRSGASISMPGMMDTLLNVGLNKQIVNFTSGSMVTGKLLRNSYSRLLESYGTTICGIDAKNFSLPEIEDIDEIIMRKEKILNLCGYEMPQDPYAQLIDAIIAVVNSWNSSRAQIYRKLQNISDDLGTAITIQAMVFGNMSDQSGTGVVFTRNPTNGEATIYGEFLSNAQGEDIVAGIKTPQAISVYMKTKLPLAYLELSKACSKLEDYYKDAQDIEFTVENSKLYILQTRSAKRTANAAIKIAVDLALEGKISKESALMMVDPKSLKQVMHANIEYEGKEKVIWTGLAASPGGARGKIILSRQTAIELGKNEQIIFVCEDTSPEDIEAMYQSAGFLTANGGLTSHAAVVARGFGRACVVGANFNINRQNNTVKFGDLILHEGDIITIDGSNGNIILGDVSLSQPELSKEFYQLINWAKEYNKIDVQANAENINDLKTALKFCAKGIGLCRSEHMFFEPARLRLLQKAIITKDISSKKDILTQLQLLHSQDYFDLFSILGDAKTINIRLLDPPLHEFFPHTIEQIKELADNLNIDDKELAESLKNIMEVNPMLGKRGCRLGLTHPEIYEMQIRAIFTAQGEIRSKNNINIDLEIMVPLISSEKEIEITANMIRHICREYDGAKYKIGTMIELPRAAMIADKIAKYVDYFSFGTNDLTQTVYGLSRDDSAKFLPQYLSAGLYDFDPFVKIDFEGVGAIMQIAIEKGRMVNPTLKLGMCGEQACDDSGIEFALQAGIDYISCSPYNIPFAILSIFQRSRKIA